jgi:hypothetical protein
MSILDAKVLIINMRKLNRQRIGFIYTIEKKVEN